jgi:hypothetical protein
MPTECGNRPACLMGLTLFPADADESWHAFHALAV